MTFKLNLKHPRALLVCLLALPLTACLPWLDHGIETSFVTNYGVRIQYNDYISGKCIEDTLKEVLNDTEYRVLEELVKQGESLDMATLKEFKYCIWEGALEGCEIFGKDPKRAYVGSRCGDIAEVYANELTRYLIGIPVGVDMSGIPQVNVEECRE